MFCKQCGTQYKDTARFCPGCGAKVKNNAMPSNTAVCAKCGMALKVGVKFCKQCGTPVAAPKAETENTYALCGAVLKPGAKFCKLCGAPTDWDIPAVTIPTTEPIKEVIVSDVPPTRAAWICPECGMALKSDSDFCPECSLRAVRGASASAVKQQAGKVAEKLAEKAIRRIIRMDTEASASAGEMKLAMNSEQADVLSVVVQSLLRR